MTQLSQTSSRQLPGLPGVGDFTLSAWIDTADEPGWAVGDIASQYDPATRRGMGLSVITHNGGPAAQANRRQLSFYIDDGSPPRWTSCGRPEGCRMAYTLVIHRGKLLAGLNIPNGRGRLTEYVAPDRWLDRGEAPDGSNTITSATVHQGQLFVTTGCYDGTGSALPKASNTTPGGGVYFIDEDFNWHDCGNPFTLPSPNQCPALFSYGDRLYLASSFHPDLFMYEGGQKSGGWKRLATPPIAMCVLAGFQGKLFCAPKSLKATMYPNLPKPTEHGPVYVMNADGSWRSCGHMAGAGRVYTMTVHNSELYAGSWPEGRTHRSATGEKDWIDVGPCGCGPLPPHELPRGEIMAMASYHGQLYVGTLPTAEVYRCDGDGKWTQVGRLDKTPTPICRVWTCAEYDGGLFFSTLPSGEVFRMDAGVGVTDPNPLPTGRHQITAARKGDELSLHVDGKCVASRRDPRVREMSIGEGVTLRIGVGPYSPFRGKVELM